MEESGSMLVDVLIQELMLICRLHSAQTRTHC